MTNLNELLQWLADSATPVDRCWVDAVIQMEGDARAGGPSAAVMPRIAGVLTERMADLLEYLSSSGSDDEWTQVRSIVWSRLAADAVSALLQVDYFSSWYTWLCRRQGTEGRRIHKGAQAFNAAWCILRFDRDAARHWARVALIEDVREYGDPSKARASRFLQSLLHEPKGDIDALRAFVVKLQNEPTKVPGQPVPERILWYPDQVLARFVSSRHRPARTTECDLFAPNLPSLEALAAALEGAGTSREKGYALEELALNLFDSVNGFEVRSFREPTRSGENDLVVRNLVTVDPVIAAFGEYLIVECKHWKKPADTKAVDRLIAKVRSAGARCGVLLSRNGVTGVKGNRKREDADLEIVKAFHRDDVYILVLTEKDIRAILAGNENLLRLMVEEYEKIKFARRTRWSDKVREGG